MGTVTVKVTRAIRTAHKGKVKLFRPGLHDVDQSTASRITRALSGSVVRSVKPAAKDAPAPDTEAAAARPSLEADNASKSDEPSDGAGSGDTSTVEPAPTEKPAPAKPKTKRKARKAPAKKKG